MTECAPAISEVGVYPISEDTLLLARFVERAAPVRVAVEVGCGSGLVTSELARRSEYTLGIDISEQAALTAKSRTVALPNVDVVISDKLSAIRSGSVDLVVSNPPYLPCDYCSEPLWCGGATGVEFSEELVAQASEILRKEGSLVILASSLSSIEKLLKCAERSLGKVVIEEEYRIGLFETLFIFHAQKTLPRDDAIPEEVLRSEGEGGEQGLRPPCIQQRLERRWDTPAQPGSRLVDSTAGRRGGGLPPPPSGRHSVRGDERETRQGPR
uniref:Methyltransferase domain-containing protein n=1 Tax=Thermofilum pendens TaxID=2269 RepID=A0A7J3X795_THEPE